MPWCGQKMRLGSVQCLAPQVEDVSEGLRKGGGGLGRRARLAWLKRIYESSRGFLEVESFNTFDSHEIWLTFSMRRVSLAFGSPGETMPSASLTSASIDSSSCRSVSRASR